MGRSFTVVAIIAAHNEADVIEHVVRDLIAQGVDVYYIDDDSTDGTREIVERYAGHGVIGIERFDGTPGCFEWERILRRKEALEHSLEADWFIHHDADEFRESPWQGVPLKEAIAQVDAVGCNAIDFQLVDFRPDHDRFVPGADVRDAFQFYTPTAHYNRPQIRTWKKSAMRVDLTSSGGHDARFQNRVVFPIRFVLRHYPIRGQTHGVRKIFEQRRPRYSDTERQNEWHVQYDEIRPDASFIHDRSTLIPYDPSTVRQRLVVDILGECEQFVAELRASHARELAAQDQRHTEAIAVTHAEIRHLQGTLQAFERSLSWRWTAPARAAYRLLTRRSA